jgi:NADH-dependent peroxiredoxin subunit F
MYDLIIIGGSAAGTAAAVYASRRKLNYLVIAKDLSGEVAVSGDVDNFPAIVHTTGIELSQKFQDQQKANEVPTRVGRTVSAVELQNGNTFRITARTEQNEEEVYEALSVIVATGSHPRYLGVPGEEQLNHRGVTYCTVCDGPLFRNRVTATIGTGNSALESALMMAEIAKKHYVLTKYPSFKGETVLIDKVLAHHNIEILSEAMTQRIEGENKVEAIVYKDKSGEEQRLEVQGVFVHIGLIPQSDFISCVEKLPTGHIVVDKLARTSVPGIFAAGDVTDIPYYQIGIATGMGITAALSAISYLNTRAA